MFSMSLARFPRPTLVTTIVGAALLIAGASVYYTHNDQRVVKTAKLQRSGAVRRRHRGVHGEDEAQDDNRNNPNHQEDLDGAAAENNHQASSTGDITDQSITDEDAEVLAWNTVRPPSQEQESLLKKLTYHIAENRAIKEGIIHHQFHCDCCGDYPIRGPRYRCTNCEDFDLCEVCEATTDHIQTHVFVKIKVPSFFIARHPASVPYPGKPWELPREVPDAVLQDVKSVYGLHRKSSDDNYLGEYEIKGLYMQFANLADERLPTGADIPWGISPRAFRYLVPITNRGSLVLQRLFDAFDFERDGLLSFKEFVNMACVVQQRQHHDQWRHWIFCVLDLDRDGYVEQGDMLAIFSSLHEIQEDITLHHLRVENTSDDYRRIDDRCSFRDFVEGSQPLPNYFNIYDSLHAHREPPIFGQHGPIHEDSPAQATKVFGETPRDPPYTYAADYIAEYLLRAYNEMLEPVFANAVRRVEVFQKGRVFLEKYPMLCHVWSQRYTKLLQEAEGMITQPPLASETREVQEYEPNELRSGTVESEEEHPAKEKSEERPADFDQWSWICSKHDMHQSDPDFLHFLETRNHPDWWWKNLSRDIDEFFDGLETGAFARVFADRPQPDVAQLVHLQTRAAARVERQREATVWPQFRSDSRLILADDLNQVLQWAYRWQRAGHDVSEQWRDTPVLNQTEFWDTVESLDSHYSERDFAVTIVNVFGLIVT